jgi:hypothetical protein
MKTGDKLSNLERYAGRQINARRYPDAVHQFRVLECADCGTSPLALTVEHHSGSRQGKFRGVIYGECLICAKKGIIYRFTGSHREKAGEEVPACHCGHRYFLVAELERIERENGLAGFFDEGLVVGKCASCNRNRVIISTD